MTEIPFEKRFHFRDGSHVGSLDELADRLGRLSYQEFYHHVNQGKNDFASWIRHVLKEEELASDLEKVQSIVETTEILNDFLHPRATIASHDDLQSKIEDDLQIHVPVEDVPTTSASAEMSDETADLEIIDEGVKQLEAPPEEEGSQEEQGETQQENGSKITAHDHVLSQSDYARMVVKDFVLGFVFGIIVGIIVGKIV